jgi:large subunit ribosomal protein L4
MSTMIVTNMKGERVGEYPLAEGILVSGRGNQAVRDAVVAHQAALRAGTADTLGKGAVAGSNKKPWRQKGTGRARAGYRQSPIWRGGGVAHGPHPRSYAIALPKKAARLAFARAFSSRVEADEVTVIDGFEISEPKTKLVAAFQKAIGAEKGLLILVDQLESNISKAARNLPNVEVRPARDVDTTTVLRYARIAATRPAMDVIAARLAACGRKAE